MRAGSRAAFRAAIGGGAEVVTALAAGYALEPRPRAERLQPDEHRQGEHDDGVQQSLHPEIIPNARPPHQVARASRASRP